MQSYCDSADPYCCDGSDGNVHQGYGTEYGQDALTFIQGKLDSASSASSGATAAANGTAADGTTSSTGTAASDSSASVPIVGNGQNTGATTGATTSSSNTASVPIAGDGQSSGAQNGGNQWGQAQGQGQGQWGGWGKKD